jgi:hypothetical protein
MADHRKEWKTPETQHLMRSYRPSSASCNDGRGAAKAAHPHRVRHTLASELSGKGGKLEVVAGILGDSPAPFEEADHATFWQLRRPELRVNFFGPRMKMGFVPQAK